MASEEQVQRQFRGASAPELLKTYGFYSSELSVYFFLSLGVFW